MSNEQLTIQRLSGYSGCGLRSTGYGVGVHCSWFLVPSSWFVVRGVQNLCDFAVLCSLAVLGGTSFLVPQSYAKDR